MTLQMLTWRSSLPLFDPKSLQQNLFTDFGIFKQESQDLKCLYSLFLGGATQKGRNYNPESFGGEDETRWLTIHQYTTKEEACCPVLGKLPFDLHRSIIYNKASHCILRLCNIFQLALYETEIVLQIKTYWQAQNVVDLCYSNNCSAMKSHLLAGLQPDIQHFKILFEVKQISLDTKIKSKGKWCEKR